MRRATKGLTPREDEISTLIAWGCSHKEIAAKLHRSTSTISNTLRGLYEKLGINKESELAAYVFCTKYGVNSEHDPLGNVKKAIAALSLLTIILCESLAATNDCYLRTMRPARARRTKTEQLIKT